jgi:hypothetical protein
MRDIIVCMDFDTLIHKKHDGMSKDGNECYWEMGRMPRYLEEGDRLFVAVKYPKLLERHRYYVQGSFRVESIGDGELVFHSDSWEDLKQLVDTDAKGNELTHFRGFRYKWWEAEEKK